MIFFVENFWERSNFNRSSSKIKIQIRIFKLWDIGWNGTIGKYRIWSNKHRNALLFLTTLIKQEILPWEIIYTGMVFEIWLVSWTEKIRTGTDYPDQKSGPRTGSVKIRTKKSGPRNLSGPVRIFGPARASMTIIEWQHTQKWPSKAIVIRDNYFSLRIRMFQKLDSI